MPEKNDLPVPAGPVRGYRFTRLGRRTYGNDAWVVFCASRGTGAFGARPGTTALLVAAGPVTAIPLVWFAMGVRRLPLSTVGILQYVTPTLQFLLAVALYREPFGRAHALAFGLIWTALALYTWDSFQASRQAVAGAAATSATPPPAQG